KRRKERAAFGEGVAAIGEKDERIAKVLQDVGAEDVIEAAAQGREAVTEIRGDEFDTFGRRSAGKIDGRDVEPARGENLGEVAAGASGVKNTEAAAVGGELAEEEAVT